MKHARPHSAGFTLLEVMVAVAILGLGLTAILSAQANAFAASAHARDVSEATGLLRCKMLEVEEGLAREGFQELDVQEAGPCCEGLDHPRMTCSWRIEKPEFPEPALGELDLDSGLDTESLGPLGALANPSGGTGLPASGDVGDLAQAFSAIGGPPPGGGGGGEGGDGGGDDALGGIFGMMMEMVYPDIKPVMEASTRRVVVTVTWRRGTQERHLSIVQWVVNPNQGVSSAEADAASDLLEEVTGGGTTGGTETTGGAAPRGGGNPKSGGPLTGGAMGPRGGGR
jgi:general secretion pathway protein I